jgi:bacterioferritin (cytochrome b1)
MVSLKCANCGDEITESPIRRGQNVYCSEACAFEAARSADCSGRSDISQVTHSADEIRQPDRILSQASQVGAALQPGLLAELAAVEVYGQHIRAIDRTMDRADLVEGLQGIMEVEQGHARDLATRIRELGGAPADAGNPAVIEGRGLGAQSAAGGLVQMLQLDLAEEDKAIQFYRTQIAAILDDAATVVMLKRHLDDETAHAKWLSGKIGTLGGA